MSNENLTFDESSFKIKSRSILAEPESPAMIRSLVNRGIVKNEKQALIIMLTMIGLFVAATVTMLYITFAEPAPVVLEEWELPPQNRIKTNTTNETQ